MRANQFERKRSKGVKALPRREVVRILRDYTQLSATIREALGALEEEDRELIKIFYLVGDSRSMFEICQVFGVGRSTIYRRRNRALDALGRCLGMRLSRDTVLEEM